MRNKRFRFGGMSWRIRVLATIALVATAVLGVTQTFASAGTSGTPVGEGPHQAEAPKYEAPKGPVLADTQVTSIARQVASLAHVSAPSEVRAVDTSLRSAMEVDPHNVLPSAPDPGMAALEASEVVVVTMRGDFVLDNARVPQGQPAPTGSVLTLILDAHTGQVEGRAVSDDVARGVAALGTARALN
ncbi:MAG: hypothetical protein H0X28_09095 [Solirubrobacterales bacterium]|nr:hypothetical protein [Solirubrobacterales bacterium]